MKTEKYLMKNRQVMVSMSGGDEENWNEEGQWRRKTEDEKI